MIYILKGKLDVFSNQDGIVAIYKGKEIDTEEEFKKIPIGEEFELKVMAASGYIPNYVGNFKKVKNKAGSYERLRQAMVDKIEDYEIHRKIIREAKAKKEDWVKHTSLNEDFFCGAISTLKDILVKDNEIQRIKKN